MIYLSENGTALTNGFYFYKELPENFVNVMKVYDNQVNIVGDTETLTIKDVLEMERQGVIKIIERTQPK